jgi:uncharacterized protein (DUF1015 family)
VATVAEIRPLSGLRYDISRITDINLAICPPYDVISPAQREWLYELDEHNYVRLEFGRELDGDNDAKNKFTRAAATLEAWIQSGILKKDAAPAIYVHDHYFTVKDKPYCRRGIIATVRLEEWEKKVVLPHEGTFPRAKSERLSLMWATSAGISPIMTLYQDKEKRIDALLAEAATGKPVIASDWFEGKRHDVWAVSDPAWQKQLADAFGDQPLYIADGHHRYESALNYKRERQTCCSGGDADADYNFVLMNILDFADPGLVVLPPHRLVRKLSVAQMEALSGGLGGFFKVAETDLSDADAWGRITAFLEGGKVSQDRLAVYGLKPGSVLLLTVADREQVEAAMPEGHCEQYRRLNVSLIDHIILEKLLGVTRDEHEEKLAYVTDVDEVLRLVDAGEYQLALLLSPVETEVIKHIADASDRMPRKATYFYPKLPSGIVCYRID